MTAPPSAASAADRAVRPDGSRVDASGADGFRADIQGLRAVAVSLVLVYHVWPAAVPGGFVGVDVFFVISGFLITSHLLSRPPRRAADLAAFWARRARRLLPASLLVLLVTLAASRAVAPDTAWESTAREAAAAALYVENWVLAATSVDYLDAERAASPVQHFWSLSVEEQFYLGWPVLLLLLAAAARRLGTGLRGAVLGAVGLLVLLSLGWSVRATSTEPASAYFVTPTRLWELGAGALLAAVLLPRQPAERVRPPRAGTGHGRAALAWAGLLAIGVAAWTFSAATPFPGWRALLPVLGAAAVLGAASPASAWSPTRLLALRPAQWLGNCSYSAYLWHWPLVVLLPHVSGGRLGALDRAAVLGVTLLLAAATKRWVEDVFRAPSAAAAPLRTGPSLRWAGVSMACVVGVAGVQVTEVSAREASAVQALTQAVASGGRCFGAGALVQGPRVCPEQRSGPVVPAPSRAAKDRSSAYDGRCFESAPFSRTRTCTFGDPDGTVDVALVGNSHAGHWLPALEALAPHEGLRITTFLASECTVTTTPVQWDAQDKQEGCLAWSRRVQAATSDGQFDLVVTAERNGRPAVGQSLATSQAAWRAGYAPVLQGWARGGSAVLVLHDTPFPASTLRDPVQCLAQHPDDLSVCSGPRADWVPEDPLFAAAQELGSRTVVTADLTDGICGPTRCSVAVGGVTAYFDGSHVSATYARTLAPLLAPALRDAVRRVRGA